MVIRITIALHIFIFNDFWMKALSVNIQRYGCWIFVCWDFNAAVVFDSFLLNQSFIFNLLVMHSVAFNLEYNSE